VETRFHDKSMRHVACEAEARMTFEMHLLGLEAQPAEAKACTLTIIRQRREETVEQAFFRHYAEQPEDAASGQIVFLYALNAALP
jgi:hypothetical protein